MSDNESNASSPLPEDDEQDTLSHSYEQSRENSPSFEDSGEVPDAVGRTRGKTEVYLEEDEEEPVANGDSDKVAEAQGFEVKGPANAGAGVPKLDVEDHMAKTKNVRWSEAAHEPLCCGVDSKTKTPQFMTPGGEFAEFVLALNIYEKLSDTFVDEIMCATFLKAQLEIDPKDPARKSDRPFVFHTSADAIARLAEAVKYEGSEPFNILEPPEELIPELEAEISKTENFGCGYMKLLLNQSDDFFTRKKLIRLCTSTLFSLLWMVRKSDKSEEEGKGETSPSKMKRRNSLSSFLKSIQGGGSEEDLIAAKQKDQKKKAQKLGAGEKRISPDLRRIKIMIDAEETDILETPPGAILKQSITRNSGQGSLAAVQSSINGSLCFSVNTKAVLAMRKMMAESVARKSQRFIDEKQLFKSMNDLGNAQLEQLIKFTAKGVPSYQLSFSFSLAKRMQAKNDLVVFLKGVESLTECVKTEGLVETQKKLATLENGMREGELNQMRVRSPELAERLLGMIKAVQRLVELKFDKRDQVLKEYKLFESSAVKMIKTVPYISSKYVPLLAWVQDPIEKATTEVVKEVRARMENVEMDVSIKLYLEGRGGAGEYSLAMDAMKCVEKVKMGKADPEEKKLAARLTSRKSAIEAMKIIEGGEDGDLPGDLADQRKESIIRHVERMHKIDQDKRKLEAKLRRAEQKAQKAVLRNVHTGSVVASSLSGSLNSGSLNSSSKRYPSSNKGTSLDVVSELSVSDAGMTDDKAMGIIGRLQMKKGLFPQSPGYSHLFRGPDSHVTTDYASSVEPGTDTESMAGSISKYQVMKKNASVEDAWNQLEAEEGSTMTPHPPSNGTMKSKSPISNRVHVPGEVFGDSGPSTYRSMPSSRDTASLSTNSVAAATLDRAKEVERVQEMNAETTRALLLARALRQRNEATKAGLPGSQTARAALGGNGALVHTK